MLVAINLKLIFVEIEISFFFTLEINSLNISWDFDHMNSFWSCEASIKLFKFFKCSVTFCLKWVILGGGTAAISLIFFLCLMYNAFSLWFNFFL